MKILVVDDEDVNALILRKMLEKGGHEVVTVSDGQQAVDQVDIEIPDLILMDVMMPVMDGYEATKLVKEKYKNTFIPIVFITALSAKKAQVSCLEKGGDDFINKPFEKNVLLAKLVAIERTILLHKENQLQKEKLELQQLQQEEEKKVAEGIFNNLLHKNNLITNYIDTYRKPADTFNGDVIMAANNSRGGVNVMLGDFTGHGLIAAICTLPVVNIFYEMSEKGSSILEIISELNKNIINILPNGRFFCANLVSLNREKRVLEIVNAGMPDVILYNKNLGIRKKISSKNLPLGIVDLEKSEFKFERHDLLEGDQVFLYSDGLLEAEDKNDKSEYGQDKLESFIEKHQASDQLVDNVKIDLISFSGGENFHDDVSFLNINCDPK